MKIHVYYRHYNVNKVEHFRPNWFSYDKCVNNFLRSIEGLNNVRTNLIMDNGPDINGFDQTYHINAGSDKSSFFQTVEIIKNDPNVGEDDIIYLLENDYMHVEGWVEKVINLFSTYSVNYVSLYDHFDKYTSLYDGLGSVIIATNTHHWRTTPSTCGSFLIKKWLFDEDYDILSTMEGDHNKFLFLNQTRGRVVLTPIPGLSTHCMEGLLSPTIKWNQNEAD